MTWTSVEQDLAPLAVDNVLSRAAVGGGDNVLSMAAATEGVVEEVLSEVAEVTGCDKAALGGTSK